MKRRIVEVLELAGGGVVLLLECLHEILRPLGDVDDNGYATCAQCVRRRAERASA